MNLLSLQYGRPTREQASGLMRRLSKPLGWPTHTATIVVFVAALGASCNYLYPFCIALLGVPCLAIWWSVRALCSALSMLMTGPPTYPRRKLGWLVLPFLVAIATGLLTFDLPERALFAIYRPALEKIVASAAATPGPITWTRHVGLYGTVTITKPAPGVIGVSIPGMGVGENDGFVYLANDVVPPGDAPEFGWIGRGVAPHWFSWIRASY